MQRWNKARAGRGWQSGAPGKPRLGKGRGLETRHYNGRDGHSMLCPYYGRRTLARRGTDSEVKSRSLTPIATNRGWVRDDSRRCEARQDGEERAGHAVPGEGRKSGVKPPPSK